MKGGKEEGKKGKGTEEKNKMCKKKRAFVISQKISLFLET